MYPCLIKRSRSQFLYGSYNGCLFHNVVCFANSNFFQVLPIKTSLFVIHPEKEMGKVCTDSVECQDNLDCINGRCSCNRSTYWNGIRCDQSKFL